MIHTSESRGEAIRWLLKNNIYICLINNNKTLYLSLAPSLHWPLALPLYTPAFPPLTPSPPSVVFLSPISAPKPLFSLFSYNILSSNPFFPARPFPSSIVHPTPPLFSTTYTYTYTYELGKPEELRKIRKKRKQEEPGEL